MPKNWLQFRGDPAIRQFLFQQTRIENDFDECADETLFLIDKLMRGHGIFHTQIHCAGVNCWMMVWSLANPFVYNILQKEDMDEAVLFDRFPETVYPENASVPPNLIRPILMRFKQMRLADETVYLRAASLNVINGMVELKFSCDGHHYIDFEAFLDEGHYEAFTGGATAIAA